MTRTIEANVEVKPNARCEDEVDNKVKLGTWGRQSKGQTTSITRRIKYSILDEYSRKYRLFERNRVYSIYTFTLLRTPNLRCEYVRVTFTYIYEKSAHRRTCWTDNEWSRLISNVYSLIRARIFDAAVLINTPKRASPYPILSNREEEKKKC